MDKPAKSRYQFILTSDAGRGWLKLNAENDWQYTFKDSEAYRFETREDAQIILQTHPDFQTLTVHSVERKPEE